MQMLKNELSDILNRYFEKVSEQNINGLYENLKNFSVKQVEQSVIKMLQKTGKADMRDFQKNYKNYIFTKSVVIKQTYNYPNKKTEEFIEKLLNDIEYTVQSSMNNPNTALSKNDRQFYLKVGSYEADRFNRMSKTFDLMVSGEIKLKAEKQEEFINAVDQLIHDLYWMKLDKLLFDLIKKEIKEHICIAFCNALFDDHRLLYLDWTKDLFLDHNRLNQIMVGYINFTFNTNHKERVNEIVNGFQFKKVA